MVILEISNSLIILLSILVFSIVILIIVSLLLYARSKLVPSGPVKININDKKDIEVDAGSNLLETLSTNEIYLPSACGGGGTCALCRCQVWSGAGDILATESGYFTRREILDKWRLACQVKVRQDLKISVPKEVFGIKKWECEVVSNKNVATFIKEFVLKLPEGEELKFQPGGYVQVDAPPCEIEYSDISVEKKFKEDWDKLNMWGLKMVNPENSFKAYSMANHPAEGNIIKLNVRIATPPWDSKKDRFKKVNPGICSTYIFSRKPGDKVSVSGPFGEFFIKESDKEMVYIGGGAGMAPLRSHIFHLFHTLKTKRKVSYWYGARAKREIFYESDFREIEKKFPNFSFKVALSEPLPADKWNGYTGFIHQVVLDNYLSKHHEPEEIEYYLCGPPLMNDAVLKMLDELGVPEENIDLDDFGI